MPVGERKARPAHATHESATRRSKAAGSKSAAQRTTAAKNGSKTARESAAGETTAKRTTAARAGSKSAGKSAAAKAGSETAGKSAAAKSGSKSAGKSAAAKAGSKSAGKSAAAKAGSKSVAAKSGSKSAAAKSGSKSAARKAAGARTGRGPAAREPAAGPTALSTNLHRYLVMSLRHTEPFGAALTRRLEALPLADSDEREAAALALVDAVPLPPELLARVTEFVPASLADINLLWPYWDGETDPFALASLEELLALPNLERLANAAALPDPPLDVRPLLALPRLRHVEMWDSSYCYRGSHYALWTNKQAGAQLEAAGFRRVPAPGTTWVFERG